MSPRASLARSDFRTLFDEQFDYVWNTLRHLGVRARDIEDVAHEVFLSVHERYDHYDRSRPIRPWLFAFAFRVASDYRRLARHRVEVLGTQNDPVDPARGAEEELIVREERELAIEVLAAIDFERRAVFVLHELDEVPIPAVAEALGIPMNTAYSRLRIARKEFAEAARRFRCARGDR